ncbi:MAG: ornithine carbamoyltransferase, partial [Treponema sp.]|jgi:ornithine carbamoyltransferase|nr:ornithine carbamoyltransferase [Treponema sp.]
MGLYLTIITPPELNPDPALLSRCEPLVRASGAKIQATADLGAVEGADALYTDVWTSMGEEAKKDERKRLLEPYRVDQALMNRTGRKDSIFMHCLPAVKGEEVTAEVLDGPQSRAWDEAENRKHTIKAIMLATLGCA